MARPSATWQNVSAGNPNAGAGYGLSAAKMQLAALDPVMEALKARDEQEKANAEAISKANTGNFLDQILRGETPNIEGKMYDSNVLAEGRRQYTKDEEARAVVKFNQEIARATAKRADARLGIAQAGEKRAQAKYAQEQAENQAWKERIANMNQPGSATNSVTQSAIDSITGKTYASIPATTPAVVPAPAGITIAPAVPTTPVAAAPAQSPITTAALANPPAASPTVVPTPTAAAATILPGYPEPTTGYRGVAPLGYSDMALLDPAAEKFDVAQWPSTEKELQPITPDLLDNYTKKDNLIAAIDTAKQIQAMEIQAANMMRKPEDVYKNTLAAKNKFNTSISKLSELDKANDLSIKQTLNNAVVQRSRNIKNQEIADAASILESGGIKSPEYKRSPEVQKVASKLEDQIQNFVKESEAKNMPAEQYDKSIHALYKNKDEVVQEAEKKDMAAQQAAFDKKTKKDENTMPSESPTTMNKAKLKKELLRLKNLQKEIHTNERNKATSQWNKIIQTSKMNGNSKEEIKALRKRKENSLKAIDKKYMNGEGKYHLTPGMDAIEYEIDRKAAGSKLLVDSTTIIDKLENGRDIIDDSDKGQLLKLIKIGRKKGLTDKDFMMFLTDNSATASDPFDFTDQFLGDARFGIDTSWGGIGGSNEDDLENLLINWVKDNKDDIAARRRQAEKEYMSGGSIPKAPTK